MAGRKPELEFEYLDSDSEATDSDHGMDADSDSPDLPIPDSPASLPATSEALPPTPSPEVPTLPTLPTQPPQEPIRLTIRRINGNFVTDGQGQVRRSGRERVANTMYYDYV